MGVSSVVVTVLPKDAITKSAPKPGSFTAIAAGTSHPLSSLPQAWTLSVQGRTSSQGIFSHPGLGFVTHTASLRNKFHVSSGDTCCHLVMHFLSELPGVAVMATTLIPSHLPITTQPQATHTPGVTHFWKESMQLQVSMCHLRNKPFRAMPILCVLSKPVIKDESAK